MSVSLAVAGPRTLSVGRADDPYKKHWWVILAALAGTAVWLCLPLLLEPSVGSGHVDAGKPAADASGEQGLNATGTSHAFDLTMGAAAKSKGAADEPGSMLYQGLDDATAGSAAPGAPVSPAAAVGGSASGGLAAALKAVGKGADPTGWGGETARRGFEGAHLSGGSLSGLGSVSGGHAGSAGSPYGAFGARNAQTSESAARGLVDDGAPGASRSLSSLSQLASGANRAAGQRGDASVGGMSRLFDGAKGGSAIAAPGGGGSGTAFNQLYGAAANLKGGDAATDLNTKKITEPPATAAPTTPSSNQNQQMMEMIGMMVVGGLVGGMMGQAIMMGGMAMMQQQNAAAANTAAQNAQKAQCQANPHMAGCS
jgi:hypothetical protein